MKLKYYLRGLGIGMIVTALILGISFSDRKDQAAQTMTDDQIKERAEQLGMVDSSELTLAALQNSAKEQPESEPAGQPETVQEETPATQETEEIATEEIKTEEIATGEKPSEQPDVTTESGQTELLASENEADMPQQSQTAEITIPKGASSGSVSTRLCEAGLVENAKAFDNYLCNNGYSRSINPGTYEITIGTSEEEIAKIITGKH